MAYRLSVAASGSWTPTLTGGTAAGSTTYTTQAGTYSLLGNILIATFNIVITGATGTGDARIGNLPFTIKAGTIDFVAPLRLTEKCLIHLHRQWAGLYAVAVFLQSLGLCLR